MGRKLRRSKHDKVLAGVCGGIAEYFNLDPTIIRLGFVMTIFFGGVGVVAYIVGMFIMPEQENYKPGNGFNESKWDEGDRMEYDSEKDFSQVMGDSVESGDKDSQKSKTFVGVSLILLGALFLAKQYIDISIDPSKLIPIAFVVIGFLIVFRSGRK